MQIEQELRSGGNLDGDTFGKLEIRRPETRRKNHIGSKHGTAIFFAVGKPAFGDEQKGMMRPRRRHGSKRIDVHVFFDGFTRTPIPFFARRHFPRAVDERRPFVAGHASRRGRSGMGRGAGARDFAAASGKQGNTDETCELRESKKGVHGAIVHEINAIAQCARGSWRQGRAWADGWLPVPKLAHHIELYSHG